MRAIRTLAVATAALTRHAAIEGEIAAIEEGRSGKLADINTAADQARQPLDKELAAIGEALEPWWSANGGEHTSGKRKSAELGGCMIGTRSSKEKLAIAGDQDALVEDMRTLRWAKPYVRVTYSIDKQAVLPAMVGKHGEALRSLGFSVEPASDTFFVKRVAQGGVVGGKP